MIFIKHVRNDIHGGPFKGFGISVQIKLSPVQGLAAAEWLRLFMDSFPDSLFIGKDMAVAWI